MSIDLGRFPEYERQVRAYSSSWYLNDERAIEALQRNPRARARAIKLHARGYTIGTDDVYQTQAERWLPVRTPVQDGVLDRVLQRAGIVGTDHSPLPIAALILGLPGSGKSKTLARVARTVLSRVAAEDEAIVDADAVRAEFSEYARGLGSEVVQVETAYVTYKRLTQAVYSGGGSVILDSVGDPDLTVSEAEYLTDAGWTVLCLCSMVDVDVAVDRAKRRALETGRYVPERYIRSIGRRSGEAYDAVRTCGVPLIGSALLDTSGDEGKPPIVVQTDDEELFGTIGGPTTAWDSSAT